MEKIFKYYITATALTVVTSLLTAMTVHASEPVIVPDDVKEISE